MNRLFAKATAVAVISTAAFLVTGCSAGYVVAPDNSTMTGSLSIQGNVHGGNLPVIDATVQLMTVGTTGYGSTATNILTSAVTTSDGTGASNSNANAGNVLNTLEPGGFILTGDYTCTSATYVYALITGGNPGLSNTNSAIALATPLGSCSTLLSNAGTTFINVNEVTTAATAIALGQYFNSATSSAIPVISDSIGSPSTTQALVGIANAFSTVNTLVNTGTGVAITSSTYTNATTGNVTVAPEATKLDTIANILAACVNSAGPTSTGCITLFPAVTPTGSTAPTDTLQAAVYMSLNPTSTNASPASTNMPALYGLQTSSGEPFTNALAAQPTDWTVGILYTGGTTPLNDPQNMAADASGNIWVINHNGTTSASLTELNPVGSPLVNVSTIGGQSISIIQPRNEAVDLNGNVWLDTTSSARELEYNVGTPANSISYTPPTGGSPYGIAIDKNNNVFYTHESSSATATVDEFLAPSVSAGATLASTALVEYALASATCCGNVVQEAEYAAIDTSGNLWMTNGSSTSGDETNIFVMSAYNGATAGVCTVFPCAVGTTGDTTLTQTYTNAASATGNVPTLSEPWGIAAGTGGSIWTPNKTGNTVTEMTAFTTGTNFGSAVSLNAPEYVAVDGAGNVWVVNDIATPASVSEFSSAGAVLSPTTTTTSFATTPVIGFSHAGMSTSQGITIDPSGNIWIANSVSSTGGVFEIVGAATPTVTPIALALKNGTVGVRP